MLLCHLVYLLGNRLVADCKYREHTASDLSLLRH